MFYLRTKRAFGALLIFSMLIIIMSAACLPTPLARPATNTPPPPRPEVITTVEATVVPFAGSTQTPACLLRKEAGITVWVNLRQERLIFALPDGKIVGYAYDPGSDELVFLFLGKDPNAQGTELGREPFVEGEKRFTYEKREARLLFERCPGGQVWGTAYS
ncbi:hypothetical protein HY407_01840 [Candidatus Gottesmanbacteria bacterium]|nr:hypothetical protein [Candidatus Gottesmanbacteria bacterium]